MVLFSFSLVKNQDTKEVSAGHHSNFSPNRLEAWPAHFRPWRSRGTASHLYGNPLIRYFTVDMAFRVPGFICLPVSLHFCLLLSRRQGCDEHSRYQILSNFLASKLLFVYLLKDIFCILVFPETFYFFHVVDFFWQFPGENVGKFPSESDDNKMKHFYVASFFPPNYHFLCRWCFLIYAKLMGISR